MNQISLTNLKRFSKDEVITYYSGEKVQVSSMEIHLETEEKQNYFSIILTNDLDKPVTKIKKSLVIEFIKDRKKGSFFYIKKCLEENENDICPKKEIPIQIKSLEDSKVNKAKYDIFFKENGFKIYSKNELIHEEEFDFQKNVGETSYFEIKTETNYQNLSGKNFAICYIPDIPDIKKVFRNLQEGGNGDEGGEFDYLEIDDSCLKTTPNYLREGNVEIIPSVKLNLKDKNGKFPSSYPVEDLEKLVNLEHSQGAVVTWQAAINCENLLVINLQTDFPGEIYLTSKYFKNIDFDKYIIKINNMKLNTKNTMVEMEPVIGGNLTLKIYPRSKYGSPLTYMAQSDIELVKVKAKLPDNSVIDVKEGVFNQDEKAIIFNKKFNTTGEISITIEYNNSDISCSNCKANVTFEDIDFKISDIQYSKTLELGQVSNLTIMPKDKYDITIPIKEIFDKLDIKCVFDNKELNIVSKLDEKNNKIILTYDDKLTKSGNVNWIITYNGVSIEFTVILSGEAVIDNSKFYLWINSTEKEIEENNTEIEVDVDSDFQIVIKLCDVFKNFVGNIDSADLKEAQMYGNDMTPIDFNITRIENEFYLSIPDDNIEDFKYLVSGDNYEIKLQLIKEGNTAYFYFPIYLASSKDDKGYGNGLYDVNHFTVEPNEKIKMNAGENYTFYLNLRTEKDLLYHRELDINEHLKYNLAFEDPSFNLTAYNQNQLGIYKIVIFSTKARENKLALIFDNIELKKKVEITIQSNPVPNPELCEIINKTEIIDEDLDPIIISVILRDAFNNEFINRKDVLYKKNLFMIVGNEKPEQTIELDSDYKTYVLKYVPENKKESLNITVVFNDSNILLPIETNIIVKLNIKTYCEPEELVVNIGYKPGRVFLYRFSKNISLTGEIEEDTERESMGTVADFILYIRDKYFERGENNTKIVWYQGYFGIVYYILQMGLEFPGNSSIYDKTLKEIIRERNDFTAKDFYYSLIENNNNMTDGIAFIKIDFNENGEIRNIYYPRSDKFSLGYMDIINEIKNLVIPKISAELFSDDIFAELDEMLKEKEDEDKNITNNNSIIFRRLSEATKKRQKKSKNEIKKIKKITYNVTRYLQKPK